MAMGDSTGSNQQGGAYGGGGLQGGYGSGGGENAGGGRGSGGLGYGGGGRADAGGNFGMGFNGSLGITGGDAGIAANQQAEANSLVGALRGLGGGFGGLTGDTLVSAALADMGLGYQDRAEQVGFMDALASNRLQGDILGGLMQGLSLVNPNLGMAMRFGDMLQKSQSTGLDAGGMFGGVANLGGLLGGFGSQSQPSMQQSPNTGNKGYAPQYIPRQVMPMNQLSLMRF
jgi:hypothetical protein